MQRRLNTSSDDLPIYSDGCFLYYTKKQTETDYPTTYLELSDKGEVWFREIEIFDKSRFQYNMESIEVTIKLAVSFDKSIKANNFIEVDGTVHEIFNVAHPYNNSFRETEITCRVPVIDIGKGEPDEN